MSVSFCSEVGFYADLIMKAYGSEKLNNKVSKMSVKIGNRGFHDLPVYYATLEGEEAPVRVDVEAGEEAWVQFLSGTPNRSQAKVKESYRLGRYEDAHCELSPQECGEIVEAYIESVMEGN